MSPLLKRIITALFLIPLVIFILLKGNPWVAYFFGAIGLGMLGEWVYNLLKAQKTPMMKLLLLAAGTPYIICGTIGFYQVYQIHPLMALHFLMVIWITDTAAFFTGKTIGGPKLWPAVSPNKTWSGAIGGVIFVALYYFFLTHFYGEYTSQYLGSQALVHMILVSIVGQLGDLLESASKRFLKIKDTSQLLPGHGGLLDRLDSFLAVGLMVFIAMQIFYK